MQSGRTVAVSVGTEASPAQRAPQNTNAWTVDSLFPQGAWSRHRDHHRMQKPVCWLLLYQVTIPLDSQVQVLLGGKENALNGTESPAFLFLLKMQSLGRWCSCRALMSFQGFPYVSFSGLHPMHGHVSCCSFLGVPPANLAILTWDWKTGRCFSIH